MTATLNVVVSINSTTVMQTFGTAFFIGYDDSGFCLNCHDIQECFSLKKPDLSHQLQ